MLCCFRYLEAEDGGKTSAISQYDIARAVDITSAQKVNSCIICFLNCLVFCRGSCVLRIVQIVLVNFHLQFFDLNLKQFGPYRINYTRNGR